MFCCSFVISSPTVSPCTRRDFEYCKTVRGTCSISFSFCAMLALACCMRLSMVPLMSWRLCVLFLSRAPTMSCEMSALWLMVVWPAVVVKILHEVCLQFRSPNGIFLPSRTLFDPGGCVGAVRRSRNSSLLCSPRVKCSMRPMFCWMSLVMV